MSQSEVEAPEGLSELTKTAYQLWRHSPLTALFLRFVEDRAALIKDQVFDIWTTGGLTNPPPHIHPEMTRGRYLELTELHALKLEDIRGFYGMAETPDKAERS